MIGGGGAVIYVPYLLQNKTGLKPIKIIIFGTKMVFNISTSV